MLVRLSLYPGYDTIVFCRELAHKQSLVLVRQSDQCSGQAVVCLAEDVKQVENG